MSKTVLHGITYGDEVFAHARQRAYESLLKYTDKAYLFTEKDLSSYKEQINSQILYPGARGGGYWVFKSIFLHHVLSNISYGEAVMWVDAGVECIADISVLTNIAKDNKGFCLFQQIHKNSNYTKRDCFYYMNADEEIYHNTRQCDAAIQIYIKNNLTLNFINDYLQYCNNPNIVTDLPNICNLPNLDGFIDHRHDQSILTNLTIKYNIDTFIHPTQWYTSWHDNHKREFLNKNELEQSSKYYILFNHHRNR